MLSADGLQVGTQRGPRSLLPVGKRLPGRGYGTGLSPRRGDIMRISEAGNDCLVNWVLINALSSFDPYGEAGETATDHC